MLAAHNRQTVGAVQSWFDNRLQLIVSANATRNMQPNAPAFSRSHPNAGAFGYMVATFSRASSEMFT
jgi:hypothetical protein